MTNPLEGLEGALRQCAVPTRIIWAMGDIVFSVLSSEYLDQVLPNSLGVRKIPEAKLFFPEEYPDVIAEEAQSLWAT